MVYQVLILILLMLWALDGYLTVTASRKYGPDIEENPVLKGLLRHNLKFFMVFKFFDAVSFVAIIYLIINKSEFIADLLLSGFIVLYLFVTWQNYSVFREIGRTRSAA